MDYESRLASFCKTILHRSDADQNDIRRNDEFWEARNKAITDLTTLFSELEAGKSLFNAAVMKQLKEPVKSMISDQRSQQIRDTCIFLTTLGEKGGDNIKGLLREVFPTILEAMKQPNKVVSGYVDDCIISLIHNVTFKVCFKDIVTEIKESKSKMVRENCLEYLNEIILHWELNESKDVNLLELLEEALKLGLEEASVRGREVSRLAYLNFRAIFTKRADRVKSKLSMALQNKITKSEVEHEADLQAQAAIFNVDTNASDASGKKKATPSTKDSAPSLSVNVQSNPNNSNSRSPLPLRSPKPPVTETAASSIQALVRGVVTRRRSSMCNDLAAEPMVSPSQSPEQLSLKPIDELELDDNEDDLIDGFKDLAPFTSPPDYTPSPQKKMTKKQIHNSSSSTSSNTDNTTSTSSSSSKLLLSNGKTRTTPDSRIKNDDRTNDSSSTALSANKGNKERTTYTSATKSTPTTSGSRNSSTKTSKYSGASGDNIIIEQKKSKIGSLLKLKISRTMNVLYEQLEIAENLENDKTSSTSDELNDLIEELLSTSSEEATANSIFQTRVREL